MALKADPGRVPPWCDEAYVTHLQAQTRKFDTLKFFFTRALRVRARARTPSRPGGFTPARFPSIERPADTRPRCPIVARKSREHDSPPPRNARTTQGDRLAPLPRQRTAT